MAVDGPGEGDADTWQYDYYPDTGSGNDSGMLHLATSPLGKITTFSDYTYHGRPGRMVSPNGLETLIVYDGQGRVTAMTEGNATVNLTYTADGILERIEGAESEVWEIDLDQANRQTGLTDAGGNRTEYTLNPEGGREGERFVDSQGTVRKEQTREFDANNRVSLIATVNGSRTIRYDANGNLTEQTDPRHLITGYTYDALNRLTSQTLPGSETATTVAYNPRNKQTSLVDAEDRSASWLYDDFDNQVGLSSPDTGSRSFQYDQAGNLTAMADALGRTTTYTYDDENRLTAIRHNGTRADLIYDQGLYGLDRLTGESTGDYSRTYAWQQNGLLAGETTLIDGRSATIAYGYDRSRRITSLDMPGGLAVAYQRDATGAITGITATYNTTSHTVAENITHLPFGPVSGYRQGNGVVTVLGYDTDYRIASLQAGGLLDFGYTVDAEGAVLTITDHIDISGNQSFLYDNQHRLVQATGPYGALSYSYDATGNRTTSTGPSGSSTYQYATGTSRLTRISGAQATSFGYNANGNITSKGYQVFNYNADDRLSRVWLGNNQRIAAYTYDLQGKRLKKYASPTTRYYHYDQDGNLIAETDAAGALVRGYIRLDGQPLAMLTGDGSIYYYHNDHLGTPLRLTDATGTVVWAADYQPFGKAELLVNTVENNLRFSGQYYDAETGLHYNWHRFYDPETGRYVSPDPIGLAGGMNLYGYVHNDPVNFIDPEGLASFSENYHNNVNTTNNAIFGNRINTAIGAATSGQVANAIGSTTAVRLLINVAETGGLQTATLNATGALASTGVTIVVNGVLVAGSLEVGIHVGSLINAAIQTLVQQDNCQ